MCDVCHRLQATMTDGTTTTNDLLAVWTVKVIINPGTSIAQVQLPFWTRGSSMQGAKQARDSIIKLLTGMNNDINPLNFRSEKKLDLLRGPVETRGRRRSLTRLLRSEALSWNPL